MAFFYSGDCLEEKRRSGQEHKEGLRRHGPPEFLSQLPDGGEKQETGRPEQRDEADVPLQVVEASLP